MVKEMADVAVLLGIGVKSLLLVGLDGGHHARRVVLLAQAEHWTIDEIRLRCVSFVEGRPWTS